MPRASVPRRHPVEHLEPSTVLEDLPWRREPLAEHARDLPRRRRPVRGRSSTSAACPTAVAIDRDQSRHVGFLDARAVSRPRPFGTATPGPRQFFRWASPRGEVAGSPMRNIPPPAIPENPPPVLGDDQLRALLKACSGVRVRPRRDAAIVSLFLDTGTPARRARRPHDRRRRHLERDADGARQGSSVRTVGAEPEGDSGRSIGTSALDARGRRPDSRRSGSAFTRTDDAERHPSDARTPWRAGRHRGDAPASAPSLLGACLARRRRRGRRPHAARRLAVAADGWPVRRERGNGTSDRGASSIESA